MEIMIDLKLMQVNLLSPCTVACTIYQTSMIVVMQCWWKLKRGVSIVATYLSATDPILWGGG